MLKVTCLDSYGQTVTHLTQWDIDQTLIIKDTNLPDAPLFHFCNKNYTEALVVPSLIDDSGTISVKIPNLLLTESLTIFVYIYVYSSTTSAKTLATIRLPVRERVKPSEYEYVENIDVVSAEKIRQEVLDKFTELSSSLGDSAFHSVANNLSTTDAGSVLDARQGTVLKGLYDDIISAISSDVTQSDIDSILNSE